MAALAGHATFGRGIGVEALEDDVIAAFHAATVGSVADALERCLDILNLLQFTRVGRELDAAQEFGEGFIAGVVHLARELGEILLLGIYQFGMNDRAQFLAPILQTLFEVLEFFFRQSRHGGFRILTITNA